MVWGLFSLNSFFRKAGASVRYLDTIKAIEQKADRRAQIATAHDQAGPLLAVKAGRPTSGEF
jgi:hypothetical protein